ncbi:MAG TPA: DUF692 domain-containing protein [Polyangiales bacterium]|jgi:hypothetical protein|nr:DUF692 domain-containing protein [Polyangiales bacterium]
MERLGLPDLGVGLGLRTKHYAHIQEHWPAVDWFEIVSENFMFTRGRPLENLDRIAERYPIVMHGVSLSIGGTDPLDFEYLRELKQLRERVNARWISDHVCWTGVAGKNTHDLLPLPYNDETLRHVAARVRTVQDFLGQRILLENPSTYLELEASTLGEAEWIAALASEADCGLLLDVNNVFVSAYNHGFDAHAYLRALPYERVGQIHVAGHTHEGTHIVDTHRGPVIDEVWDLLAFAHARTRGVSVLLEWDTEIPEFARVFAEAERARDFMRTRAVDALAVQP